MLMRALDVELIEDGVENEAGAGFGVWVDVDGDIDAAGGLGGGFDMDSGVGRVGLGEGEEFPALWGDGGFIDDVSLSEELGFGGDQDGFGADAWREFCLECSPEVGGGDGGLALPCGGFAHGGYGFAGWEDHERTDPDQQNGCFGGGLHQ
jgi:hypothetical protein